MSVSPAMPPAAATMDPDTASATLRLLATVIGILMEDAAPKLLNPGPDLPHQADAMYALGGDIAILAAAMQVLVRRVDQTS